MLNDGNVIQADLFVVAAGISHKLFYLFITKLIFSFVAIIAFIQVTVQVF